MALYDSFSDGDVSAPPVITLKSRDGKIVTAVQIIEKLSVFYTHKDGNDEKDYEDASGFNLDTLLFSIADGATESIFSREFANMLVESFVSTKELTEALTEYGSAKSLKNMLESAIERVKARWGLMVAGKSLPWYAQEKVEQGAHTAFLGLRIVPIVVSGKKGISRYLTPWHSRYIDCTLKWEASCVGDSCLFIVRGDILIKSFPIETAAGFDNTPYLIGSVGAMDNRTIFVDSGYLAGGDCIYMLSDALAAWFLKSCEAGQMPWKVLASIGSNDEFQAFVVALRESKELRNDDSTLVSISIVKQVKS
ncbi:MAG: hypothetical protein HQK89_04585 [Nitrospirae bacterium]|nr:hypothetical protein [Nitrospirota bacterium]